ncbi:response regulator transcription factor [Alkalicoccobacillus murimartini]|uniref:DNA-binding response OmpR family regulator n=1 Tax=Alkalicoccobacillus murimartini TaxID=171685 RepID=A0ABT9YDF1_9BACI|nr:response regulator transcription factor [Alkalicoccobacillus murimartini]MDQ0205885.1 DNA-binding response OmpR family regulator [Alkalicoccobacillus murimartini]
MDNAILIIEDDAEIAKIIQDYLEREGYRVVWRDAGDKGLSAFHEDTFSLVLVDLMLPGKNGFEVCQEIRETSEIPIIVVSAKQSDLDKIHSLGIGADDYVTKPFSPLELVARIRAQIRRYQSYQSKLLQQTQRELAFLDVVIDQSGRTISLDGEYVSFTAKEYELFIYLAKNPGQVFTKEQLYRQIWHQADYEDIRTVTVHIKNIRHKINDGKKFPKYIETVWGVGYKFIGHQHEYST